MTSRMYHFTRERCLPGIAQHGLVPTVGENTSHSF